MIGKPRDKLKLRRWCVKRLLEGEDIESIRTVAKGSRRTLYYPLERFRRNGGEGLIEKSRRPPHNPPPRTQSGREGYRAQRKVWMVEVSNGSVYTILHNNTLPIKTYAPRRRTYIRFQRTHPDSLWQTDIKYYDHQYLIAFLDHCSRYVPNAILCKHATTRRILKLLDTTLRRRRIPKQILSDHGTQFYSEYRGSQFTAYLETHGIEHIMGSIRRDDTPRLIPSSTSLASFAI